MSIVVVGDVHLTDPRSAPSVRSETYTEDILDKLRWIAAQAAQRGAPVLGLGDLYHIKAPSRTSHGLVQVTHAVFQEAGVDFYATPGNHDMLNDRLASLDSQPLGALGRMSGVSIIDGMSDLPQVYAIPYLADWQTLPAHIDGYRQARETRGDDSSEWLLAMHAPIFPDSEDPPYEYLAAESVAALIGDLPTAVAYGHIHDPHGEYHTKGVDHVRFINYGAISRGSLHIETLRRIPRVYVYDHGEPLEVLEVPHRPIEEVFPMEEVIAERAKAAGLADFLAGIGSSSVNASDETSVLSAAEAAELDDDVREAVRGLLSDSDA